MATYNDSTITYSSSSDTYNGVITSLVYLVPKMIKMSGITSPKITKLERSIVSSLIKLDKTITPKIFK